MAENSISKITSGNTTYSITDTTARNSIVNLQDTVSTLETDLNLKLTNLTNSLNNIKTDISLEIDDKIKNRTILDSIDSSEKIKGKFWLESKSFKF